jgi:hypothetical protein
VSSSSAGCDITTRVRSCNNWISRLTKVSKGTCSSYDVPFDNDNRHDPWGCAIQGQFWVYAFDCDEVFPPLDLERVPESINAGTLDGYK